MNRLMKFAICGALIAATAVPALAQDDAKKKKKGKQGQNQAVAQLLKKAEAAGLDAEALGKVKEVVKEMGPKLQEIAAKRRNAIGPDTMKAMAAARKEAAKAGKKGKEAAEAAMAVLSAEQKEVFAATQKAQAEVMGEMREKLVAAIGAENAKKIVGGAGGKGKGKAKGKKKKAE